MRVFRPMQEIIDESPEIIVRPESQHNPGQELELEEKEYRIKFEQIYLSKPTSLEHDQDQVVNMFPKEARLRNLT